MAGCIAGFWGDAVAEEEPPHEVDIIRVAVISVFYEVDSVVGAPFSLRRASLAYWPESGLGVVVRFSSGLKQSTCVQIISSLKPCPHQAIAL